MKIFATAICSICIGATLLAEELTGWEKRFAHRDGQFHLKKRPRVEFLRIQGNFAEIRVTNRSEEVLTYHGHSATRPILFMKTRIDGRWVPTWWDWCGVGVNQYSLNSGESVIMTVRMYGHDRAFTIFRKKGDDNAFSFVKLIAPDEGNE